MARLGDTTWHPKKMTLGIKEWLTISHVWEMIPWLILSHVGYDVIKGNKRKGVEKGEPHIWLEEGGEETSSF